MHGVIASSIGGSFTPAKVGTPVAWWRQDLGLGLVGSDMDTWTDQIANIVASAPDSSSRPPYSTNQLNGLSAPVFSSGHTLVNTATNLLAAGSARSIFCVGKTGNGCMISIRRSTSYAAWLAFYLGQYISNDGVNGAQNCTATMVGSMASGYCFIGTMSGAGNAPTADLNGVNQTITGGVQGTESGSTGFQIGTNASNIIHNGPIADLCVYSGVLSASDIARLKTYSTARYGTP